MIGDAVSKPGVEFACERIAGVRREHNIDFCTINGENTAANGITPRIVMQLLDAGVDVITMGNHTFNKLDDFIACVDDGFPIIRPANYPVGTCGVGHIVMNIGGVKVAVVNVLGRLFIDAFDCPFRVMDRELEAIGDDVKVILVDFHAEATGEKVAMGWYLDGRVSVLAGTHTHVQTADEKILPKGTGYISDLGMTGATTSILGVNIEIAMQRILLRHAPKNKPGAGPREMCGVILDIDEKTGKCEKIERFREVE